ncbi:unnamed protein product [Ilex paraguariensis]|uniref:Uncharacterized protein n=1 Tax=Ilex paraguariensis TaxID=185542 RepID=A0ABC8UY33_9AQUA
MGDVGGGAKDGCTMVKRWGLEEGFWNYPYMFFYEAISPIDHGVLDGKYDDLPEQSFYMVGGIEEVMAKVEKIAKESAA